jgi:uncharacterized protein YgbK (DUF1537 family)
MRLLILADDLTGAADSAARCRTAGLPATILLEPAPTLPQGAVALSTDSRFLAPDQAAERVRQTVQQLNAPAAHWYKKIDSTLRGNLGAELDAMLAVCAAQGEPPLAVICPAFPAQGRGLEQGKLVFGQQQGPALHLPTLLRAQTARPIGELPLSAVRLDPAQLAQRFAAELARGAHLVVADALTDSDLAQILEVTQRVAPHALLCGSAGLIEPLARRLVATGDFPAPTAADQTIHAPIVAVIGSGSAMAHRQLAALRTAGVRLVNAADLDRTMDWGALPGAGPGVALHLPPPSAQTALEGEAARQWAIALTQAAAKLIEQMQPGTLLVTGGDTAIYLLTELGIKQLTVLCELMPGIPLLEGVDRAGQRRRIITKAGTFGDEGTLVQLFARAQP